MKEKDFIVNTLANMVSWNMSYSYMEAICFEKENILDQISKYFKIQKEKSNLEEDNSFHEIMRELLNVEKKELDTFFYYLENDLRGYTVETLNRDDHYFQDTVLTYKDGIYSERAYGISFMNNKEEYFNHEKSFEIIRSISRR